MLQFGYIMPANIASHDLSPTPLCMVLDTGTCRYVTATVGVLCLRKSLSLGSTRDNRGSSQLQLCGISVSLQAPLANNGDVHILQQA